MKNQIKIGDFVKLTGSTLKTVLYYHKIGLLPEPERSFGGYRLYGSEELSRMQFIKHLKLLGLDLTRIKEVLGDQDSHKTLREVLESLRDELLIEKESLEERLGNIEKLLNQNDDTRDTKAMDSASFQMITEILGPDKIEEYRTVNPKLFDQQRKIFGVLDDFQWGEDYRENFQALAEFFKTHPQAYQTSLTFGERLAKLAELEEDDPKVEALARESAAFIKSIPALRKMLNKPSGMEKNLAILYNDMVSTIISPAQVKHGQLLEKYLAEED